MSSRTDYPPLTEGEKACSMCGQGKPLTEFYASGRNRDGRNSRCKVCHRAEVARGARGEPPAPQPTKRERFWAKVQRGDGCWEWQGGTDNQGYGIFFLYRRGGRSRFTHAQRFAYEDAVGPIPDGLWVLHRCDNPPCVRPDHLFLGTASDNTKDMYAKGRAGVRWPLRSHCHRGHALTPDNRMKRGDGRPGDCLTCHRERARVKAARR